MCLSSLYDMCVWHLTVTFADYADQGVRVVSISPGNACTRTHAHARAHAQRLELSASRLMPEIASLTADERRHGGHAILPETCREAGRADT